MLEETPVISVALPNLQFLIFVPLIVTPSATSNQGGNFHLKVGGAKSSGNAGDPMLRVAVSFYRTLPYMTDIKEPINTTSDGTFLSVVCENPKKVLLAKSWGGCAPPPRNYPPANGLRASSLRQG